MKKQKVEEGQVVMYCQGDLFVVGETETMRMIRDFDATEVAPPRLIDYFEKSGLVNFKKILNDIKKLNNIGEIREWATGGF